MSRACIQIQRRPQHWRRIHEMRGGVASQSCAWMSAFLMGLLACRHHFQIFSCRSKSEIKQQQNEINGCSRNGPLGTLGRASSDVPR
eukprot:scaffold1517_cov125-Skeletonema_marinoi.AAC.1